MMNLIIVDAATWNATQAAIARIDKNVAAIALAVQKLGHLSRDDQAKLNKIFDAATGDSAKVDAVLSPQPPKDLSHG